MLILLDIFIALLITGYFGLMISYAYHWMVIRDYRVKKKMPGKKVSVIIAARNEANNIANCLTSLQQQDYPTELFEVIVVDDHSIDSTFEVMQSSGLTNLKSLQLQGGKTGKKAALAAGIEHANGDWIMATDADCTVPPEWISTTMKYAEDNHGVKLIAGPVAFEKGNSLLSIWQQLDLIGLMVITAATIKNGLPNMANGANLAFEKAAYAAVNGYSGMDQTPSGDDILLTLKIHQRFVGGVHFLKSQDAIVITQAETTFSSLINQRMRWVSKSTLFPNKKITAALVLAYFYNLFILMGLISCIIAPQLLPYAIAIIIMKVHVELPIMGSGTIFFKRPRLLLWIPVIEIFHILYVIYIGVASLSKRYKWKGRAYHP